MMALWWVVPPVVLGGLWVRSCRTMDEAAAVDGANVLRAAVSYRGAVHLVRAENNSTPRGVTWDRYEVPARESGGVLFSPDDEAWRWLGFARFGAPPAAAVRAGPRIGAAAAGRRRLVAPWLFTRPYQAISLPSWPARAATAVPAAAVIRRLVRRARRARRGLCPGCGYDLRATEGRCPECGETAAARRGE